MTLTELALVAVGGLCAFVALRKQRKLERAAERLRMEVEVAERDQRALSEFLANISHEIRTPMSAIVGMTDLLLQTQLTTEQRDHLETVRTSGGTLLSLLNDLLDFSKVNAGKLDLESQPYSLRSCIEDVVELFAATAAKKNLQIIVDVHPDLPETISGDALRVRQIVSNLVSNAVKFSREGEVVVSAAPYDPGHGQVFAVVAVRDTGIGIAQDKLDQLFSPFTQADASIARQYGGTGLGLAISRRLAELMDGTLSVESEEGKGSTFELTLPLYRVDETGRVVQGDSPLSGLQALLVASGGTSRKVLNLQLSGFGMQTQVAESWAQALDLAEAAADFHVAVLDLDGSEREESEARQRLLVRLAEQGMPVLAMASAAVSDLSVTPDVFLLKPARQRRLFDTLRVLLTEAPVTAQTSTPSMPIQQRALHVLVVDDNPVNQKLFAAMLSKLGHRVTVASSGQHGVELSVGQAFDAVLMDVRMPDLDGFEATARLRALNIVPRPWIIAVTGDVMRGERERCLAAGMDDYLPKPVRLVDLATSIARVGARSPYTSITPRAGLLSTKGQVLDHEFVQSLRQLGPEALRRSIELYTRDAPKRLQTLEDALLRADAQAAHDAAHALRGAAAMLGGAELARRCASLEKCLDAQDLERAARESAALKGALEAHLKALSELLGPRPEIMKGM